METEGRKWGGDIKFSCVFQGENETTGIDLFFFIVVSTLDTRSPLLVNGWD
jgi:hypothetical protein